MKSYNPKECMQMRKTISHQAKEIAELEDKIASLENELANDTKVARLITDELL